jgi:hypothetical protein
MHFVRHPSNPIFSPCGAWTNGRAIDADVLPVGDRLWLYFATRDPSGTIQELGVASAPLDSDLRRDTWRQECHAAISEPELAWEQACFEAPARAGWVATSICSTGAPITAPRNRLAVRSVTMVSTGNVSGTSRFSRMGDPASGMSPNPGLRSSFLTRRGAVFSSIRAALTGGTAGISQRCRWVGKTGGRVCWPMGRHHPIACTASTVAVAPARWPRYEMATSAPAAAKALAIAPPRSPEPPVTKAVFPCKSIACSLHFECATSPVLN